MIKMNRRKFSNAWLILVVLAGFVVPVTAAAATQWEIEPKVDSRIPIGRLAVLRGGVTADGVLLVLKNISLSTPIQVTLASEDHQQLELTVFKDTQAQPLLVGSGSRERPVTFRFRTNEEVHFLVRGPDGAHYQMMTWVGPEIQIAAPPTFIPMAEFVTSQFRSPAEPVRTAAPAGSATILPNQTAAVSSGRWIPILLGLIFLALVAIIVLLSRGYRKSAGAAVLLLALGVHASAEESVPSLVLPGKEEPSIRERVDKLGEALEWTKKVLEQGEGAKLPKRKKEETETVFAASDRVDKWTGQPIKGGIAFKVTKEPGEEKNEEGPNVVKIGTDVLQATQLTIAFLEEFGLIDPREAAVQPNFNPPGMPPLPSKCYRNPDCGKCFTKASEKLEKARQLLEAQYVIYKQTEMQAGRIMELADAAAGLSPWAKMAWTLQKTNPNGGIAAAQNRFYATYDGNLVQLLKMMNDAMIEIGACEREGLGDQDWFNRYGMPYYIFVRERYTRK
jgi:tetrahydromethanopterin S-methyltransferase subunit G